MVYGIVLNTRQSTLAEEMRRKNITKIVNPTLIVERNKYILSLYSDSVLVKNYRAVFGKNNKPKKIAGDKGTPIGEYEIVAVDTNHRYFRFYKINYPNIADLREGLRKGLLTQQLYDSLAYQFYYGGGIKVPTPLGNDIGLHGIGQLNYIFKNLPFVFNWTDGSVAISDDDLIELSPYLGKGTKIVFR